MKKNEREAHSQREERKKARKSREKEKRESEIRERRKLLILCVYIYTLKFCVKIYF